MPESLTIEDVKRLQYDPPYQIHPWTYSYFQGMGKEADEGLRRNWRMVRARKLEPVKLRRHEHVSREQPWAVYHDVELDQVNVNDGWPFQSYYYLMDHDSKGPKAVSRGRQNLYLQPADSRSFMSQGQIGQAITQSIATPISTGPTLVSVGPKWLHPSGGPRVDVEGRLTPISAPITGQVTTPTVTVQPTIGPAIQPAPTPTALITRHVEIPPGVKPVVPLPSAGYPEPPLRAPEPPPRYQRSKWELPDMPAGPAMVAPSQPVPTFEPKVGPVQAALPAKKSDFPWWIVPIAAIFLA